MRRLASEGLDAVAPLSLRDVSRWCWEEGARTGDARFCIIAKTLELLASSYEDLGAMPIGPVDRAIAEDLGAVLDDEDAASASARAWRMKERVWAEVREWWESTGHASPQ